jgi:hypothetical protein
MKTVIVTPHSGNTFKMGTSRRFTWVEGNMRKMINAHKVLGKQPQDKRRNVSGKIILRWILKKQDVNM